MGNNLNLAITLLANLHRIAEISNAVIDLDLIVQEFLKGGDIEDLVRSRLGGVDDVLYYYYFTTSQPRKEKMKFFFGCCCFSLLAVECFDVLVLGRGEGGGEFICT